MVFLSDEKQILQETIMIVFVTHSDKIEDDTFA